MNSAITEKTSEKGLFGGRGVGFNNVADYGRGYFCPDFNSNCYN